MKRYQLYNIRSEYFRDKHTYQLAFWKDFDFSVFDKIMYICRAGQGHAGESYNDCIIMADTETSKERYKETCSNYVVAWTISVRAFGSNIVTLYGHKPSEFVECVTKMHERMQGQKTIIYWFNMSYDWVFLRKFIMRKWGTPDKQLNIKAHFPLFINFNNGIIFKDALMLAQRKLEKWAEDLDVEHKKAVGFWDYDKVRNQENEEFSAEELKYIENDTLAGVECIQKTKDALNKRIYSIPYTATGIPREAVRTIGKEFHARDLFKRIVPEFYVQQILEAVFHGGYTHANRHFISTTIRCNEGEYIKCKDFSSSYPFSMLAFKFPMERFAALERDVVDTDFIIRNSEKYAFIFKLIMKDVELKNKFEPMPVLQMSKAKSVNAIEDNGRILQCEICEIWTNEIDVQLICEQYRFKGCCTEVYFSEKGYLPRWFTDYVYQCYQEKCELKNGDQILYSIAKARLNSLYGMTVQKPVKELIEEDYQTGEYEPNKDIPKEELYEKYKKKWTSILPYQWGVYVTSYSFFNLHQLGKCVDYENGGIWLYSDTDSCYATKWDEQKVEAYNEGCKEKLRANGYDAVVINGKEFWLGVAELDGTYSEFRTAGAKRYAVRYADIPKYRIPDEKGRTLANKLKITVAGVPKKGVKCLKDNIENFHKGFVFPGEDTGKLMHTYYYEEDIWTDENGNERGDSIDLSPTTYVLDDITVPDWEQLWQDETEIPFYEGDDDD